MLESSLVKYGDEIISCSIGEPLQVVFDYDKVWAYYQSLGDKKNPALLHFVHVHPSGCLGYSGLDLNCIKGFNIAFNFPVFFSIVCFDDNDLNSLEYKIATYQYDAEAKKMRKLGDPKFRLGLLLMSTDVSALKLLSYCPESVIQIVSNI
jgi:hypothetical protein